MVTYTVYDNRIDFPVIIDGDARECAKAMGITLSSFYAAVCKAKNGKVRRWHIERTILYEEEQEH